MKPIEVLFEKLPGVDKTIKVRHIEENDYGIEVACAQNLKGLDEAFGIVSKGMLKNAVRQEIYAGISNYIVRKALNKRNPNIIQDTIMHTKIVSEIEKFIGKSGFIIANGQVGTILQEIPQFKSIVNNTFSSYTGIYQIGTILDNRIYIDPNLRWDENYLIMIYNHFYNFDLNNIEEIELTTSDVKAPRIKKSIYIESIPVNSTTYKIENIQI